MKDINQIPENISNAVLNFFIEKEESGDTYWKSDNWQVVSYSHGLETLFLKNQDPTWTREFSHKTHEQELDEQLKPVLGKRFQTGYFEPYPQKKKI